MSAALPDGTIHSIVARLAAHLKEQDGRPESQPALALGIFERVGSNWLSESLREAMPQTTRLSVSNSAANIRCRLVTAFRRVFREPGSVAWAHTIFCAPSGTCAGNPGLIKETSLFFAMDTVLEMLPESPAVVLTRARIGMASSFARGRLWERWCYGDRDAQVAATARAPGWRTVFAPLLG
ncbi:hypothetical protein EES45_24155 [Streptomyces sp. ADI97-07]|uniref:hypothetical protein n=1 Tax=Streptomyces sp. ADI97-07 TaxID=1522762 RepID=UPI000F559109|nr:hypothetical protein [Streptomyces sp. ADI97-07]RPK75989.1 hypothetical protein EES45_24155 [Streptomyces sp. ADI97-07]